MEAEKTSYPKEKIRVLLLENISEIAVRNFQKQGYTQTQKLTKALPEDQLIEAVKNVHILGIRSKTHITPAVLEAAT
jgi:D-3-phosphoglycerate dehydrogenase